MQGPRAGVDACAMGWAPRVWVAMELLVKCSLCFALDSDECIFYSLKSLANELQWLTQCNHLSIRSKEATPATTAKEATPTTVARETTPAITVLEEEMEERVVAVNPYHCYRTQQTYPLSKALLKSIAEHVARFLAASHSSGSSSSSGMCKHLVQDSKNS